MRGGIYAATIDGWRISLVLPLGVAVHTARNNAKLPAAASTACGVGSRIPLKFDQA